MPHLMSYPPKGSLLNFPYTQGQGGVPVFASQDASGTVCIPTANYTNTEGVWAPAPTTSEGIPQVVLIGRLVPQTLSPTPAPLAASATYTSDNLSMGSYDKIVGSVYADQTGNLYVNQSYDGKNWDVQSTVTVSASTPTGFNIAVVAPYQQIVYTNGSTAQSTFRLNVGGKTP